MLAIDERVFEPVPWDDAVKLSNFYFDKPPRCSPIEFGFDLQRQFGDREGFCLWYEMMLNHDPELDGGALVDLWPTFKRDEPGKWDTPLIEEISQARKAGCNFSAQTTARLDDLAAREAVDDRTHKIQRELSLHVADKTGDTEPRSHTVLTDYVRGPRMEVENNNPDNAAFLLDLLELNLRWNSWLERVEIKGGGRYTDPSLSWSEWTALDDTVVSKLRMRAARTKSRFCPSKDFLWDALITLAHRNVADPACDLIEEFGGGWDGVSRLSTWLTETCGVSDDEYHQAVSRNVIGGMVRRILWPGCKHDEIAVLIGAQGAGKSTLISALAPRPEWFTESIRLADEAKELVLSLAGKSVVEISEMGTRTKDVNAIKAMVSRTHDAGRPAYARAVSERPRRNIFIASTNDDSPLIDDTGNRRFLPVHVRAEINLPWLKDNLGQLIGEAAVRAYAGETFAVPRAVWREAAAAQEGARNQAEYELYLSEWFAETALDQFVTAADLSEMVKNAAGRSVNSNRYGKVMRRLGFISGKKRVEGKPVTVWHRGALDTATRVVPFYDQGRVTARLRVQVGDPMLPPPPVPAPRVNT